MVAKTYNRRNMTVSYLSVTRTDLVKVGGQQYVIQHVSEDVVESKTVKLSVSAEYSDNHDWCNIYRSGYVNTNDPKIPSILMDGCRLWMSTDGYQDMSLVEFLTSLGVLR